jgi:hypothetical protein
MGKNSKLNKNKEQETFAKDKRRNKIEKTGFFVVITKMEDKMEKLHAVVSVLKKQNKYILF